MLCLRHTVLGRYYLAVGKCEVRHGEFSVDPAIDR